MKSKSRPQRLHLPVVLAVLTAVASAALANANELVENSPFIPEGWEPPREREPRQERQPDRNEPRPLDKLEFRGLTTFNGQQSISLHDPESNRSFWLTENQSEAGFRVLEFRADEEAVIVQHGDDTRTIQLHEAKVQETEEPERAPRPSGRRSRRSSNSEEAEDPDERMQNLAEEIRRRREIRRQILDRSNDDNGQQTQSQGAPRIPGR